MKKNVIISFILFLLLTFAWGTSSLAKKNCGESCIRQPQKEVEGSFNIHSKKSNGRYFETYTISVEKGDIITAHLYSEDFATYLKLYDGGIVVAKERVIKPEYIYPGEIPYWQSSLVYTATHSGTYTLVVATTKRRAKGTFTIDWTVGGKEKTKCDPVDCDTVI